MVKEFHCDLCHCPKEIWESLKSYPSDNSCAFYSDVFDTAWNIEEETGFVAYENLLQRCYSFKENYPDIADFEMAVQECYSIFKDTGVCKLPSEALI